MSKIALIIDGTYETLLASQIAMVLASSSSGKRLEAYALIEGNKFLKSTGFAGPGGLCGSGVFMQAYEQMLAAMVELCESLMDSLRARVGGANIVLEDEILV